MLCAQSYFNVFHVTLDTLHTLHYELYVLFHGSIELIACSKTDKLKLISHDSIVHFVDSSLLLR
jgi:hypothetical protein